MHKIFLLPVLFQIVLTVSLDALIIKTVQYPHQNVEIVIKQSESNDNSYTSEVRRISGEPSGTISSASFYYSGNRTGWNVLTTWTNPNWNAEETSYYVGKCEGSLGTDLHFQLWHNVVSKFCEDKQQICENIKKFIIENTRWVESMIQIHKNESQYWYQVNLVYNQLKGIVSGYNEFKKPSEPELTTEDFLFMNMRGDMYDLVDKFKPKGSPPRKLFSEGHCSAIIKLLPKNEDLYVSHNTWTRYSTMTRVLKNYGLNFQKSSGSNEIIPGHHTSFSSYPGVIHSIDDFYIMSSGLAVQETTIGNSNADLWKHVRTNGTVFEYIRILVANRLATCGKTWSKIFSQYNSGTYNNQWMIVDYNKFKKGKPLKKGVLWILEQIPGHVRAQDQTSFLKKKTYWPSYNIPFYKDIFKLSGNDELVKKYGEWFSYNGSPRAKIFKRDHKKIKSMSGLMSFMRSNNYKHDPFSRCNCTPPYSASNAIASRHDLNPANGSYPFPSMGHRPAGATDAKLVNSTLIRDLSFIAVSGPTAGTNLPVFKWSASDFEETQLHLGQPDEWNFNPILFKPNLILNNDPFVLSNLSDDY